MNTKQKNDGTRSLAQRFAYTYASVFAIPQLAKMHYALLKLALRGLGVLNYYDDKVSGERFFIMHLLPRLIANVTSPVFFDVGANRGSYSLQLAKAFPNATIYAFEPHPKNYAALAKLDLNNFYPQNKALGEAVGVTSLYDHSDMDGSTNASLFPEVISEIHHNTLIAHAVEVDTVDAVCNSLGINHIHLLKIDTEGNELSVLRGSKTLLERRQIDVVQFEFNEMNIISRSFFYDFRKLLQAYGFFRLLPKGLVQVPDSPLTSELFGFQNVLAISKELTELL